MMLGQEELLQQKVEVLLEMHSKKVLTELQQLREQVASLQEAVTDLKRARAQPVAPPIAAAAQAQPAPPAEQQQVSPSTPQPAQQQAQPQQAPQPTAQHQEQPTSENKNNLPPELSIDKVFYCGNR